MRHGRWRGSRSARLAALAALCGAIASGLGCAAGRGGLALGQADVCSGKRTTVEVYTEEGWLAQRVVSCDGEHVGGGALSDNAAAAGETVADGVRLVAPPLLTGGAGGG